MQRTMRFATAIGLSMLMLASLPLVGWSQDPAEQKIAALPEGTTCHAVGLYMPTDGNKDNRVTVEIRDAGTPMVVVLCSYFDVEWNVSVDPKADVRQIILAGWFNQSVIVTTKAKEAIPVAKFIGSSDELGNASKKSGDYFWAYAWHTAEGRKMREKVKAITGLEISSFQGEYQANKFLIDGKRGALKDGEQPAKNADTSTRTVAAEIVQDRATAETYVRRLFEIEIQEKQQQIEQAEADLKRIKEKLAKRKAEAEKIIQERVELLMQGPAQSSMAQGNAKRDTTEVESQNPSMDGWRLWQERKFYEAIPQFRAAISRDAKDGSAWNGLGWCYLPMGKFAEAADAFRHVLEIEPKNPGAMNGLGRSLLAMGKVDEAEKVLLEATEMLIGELGEEAAVKSQVTAAWFGLVEVYLTRGDQEQAKKWIDRYLKHAPNDPNMMLYAKRIEKGS